MKKRPSNKAINWINGGVQSALIAIGLGRWMLGQIDTQDFLVFGAGSVLVTGYVINSFKKKDEGGN